MKAILLVTLEHLTTAFRERITLFWFIIFPMFLLVMLTLIFGNMGQEGEINFPVTLLNEEPRDGGMTDFAAIVEGVFEGAGEASHEGKEPLFTLTQPSPGEDVETFLTHEKDELRLGRRAAVIVIPRGFNQALLERMLLPDSPPTTESTITVYTNEGNAASEMATSIIEQIFAGIDREILAQTDRFDEGRAVPTETKWVGKHGEEVSYVDFLLPGMILMGFFVTGLFGVPGSILFARDRRILRRYWVTPLTVPRYLAGFSLGHIGLCTIQFVLLYLLGRFAFGASISFAKPESLFYLILASITFLSFGFFIASIAKTANSGMAIANVLNMPMMFLGGLFFPIGGLPWVLKAIVLVNPLTYLAEGLRTSLGVQSGTISSPLTIGVPLCWIVLCILIASLRLNWDVER
ncbi:MAG: ABC transporter permease [Candidatus Bipolaricaulota bacterium]|nr:ABC transporter permease [Candidatus Bipolaricaulota bacterium]